MKTILICNECHKKTYNQNLVEDLKCWWCGSDNVGIEEVEE